MKTELTPQQALIELNRLKFNGYMPTDTQRRDAAIEIAESAINKQLIPREPSDLLITDIVVSVCPICEEDVNAAMNFCQYCGQALDWENY